MISSKFEIGSPSSTNSILIVQCSASVLGPGVAKVNCTRRTWPISPEMLRSANATWGPYKHRNPVTGWVLPMFYTTVKPDYERPPDLGEAAILTVGLLTLMETDSKFVEITCELLPAVVRYSVTIEEGTMKLPQRQNQGDVVILANNTKGDIVNLTNNTKVRGLQKNLCTMVGPSMGVGFLIYANATVSHLPYDHQLWQYQYNLPEYGGGFTPSVLKYMDDTGPEWVKFKDPMPDILFTFNKYMLRAGALTASWSNITELIDEGLSIQQTVPGQTFPLVYSSDLRWYAAAASVQLVVVMLILPLFWGWWTLGSDLTLSPFNIALAFDAPMLRTINSAAGAKGVVQELGGTKVQLGMVQPHDKVDTLGNYPEEGYTSGRLGVGFSQDVVQPQEGDIFRE